MTSDSINHEQHKMAGYQGSTMPMCLVVAWLSGSALVSINVVTLHRERLILGWVTVCG